MKYCQEIHLTFSFSKCHLSKQQFELKLLLFHFWKLSIIKEAQKDGWELLPLQNCLIFEVSWNLSCNKMTCQKLIKERNNSLGTFNNRWRFWGKNPKRQWKLNFMIIKWFDRRALHGGDLKSYKWVDVHCGWSHRILIAYICL